MADKDISIAIKTTADTAGAKAATEALRKLAAQTEATADKARVSEWAHYDLDAPLKKVAVTAEKLESSTKKATTATAEGAQTMGKAGMLANQASFQIGDFATQVEMGTSAMRAFSQQAPQLIGAFTMAGVLSGPVTMALAGAAVALPIITIGVKALGGAFGDAEQAAKDSAAAITKYGERETADLEKQIAGRMDALERQAAKEDALANRRPKTKEAESEYSEAVLENARKYDEIQAKLAGTLGIKLDRMREIEKIEDRAEQRLQKKAAEDLAAQQELLQQAQQREATLNQRLATMDAEAEAQRAALAKALAERKALYEQRRALEAAVANGPGFFEGHGFGSGAGDSASYLAVQARKTAATSARAQLTEGGPWDAAKSVTDQRIEKLTAGVAKLDHAVEALGTDAMKAGDAVADQADAVATQTKTITETLDGAVKVLQGEEVLAKGQAMADSLAESVGTIKTTNDRVASAKDAVAAAAKDGVLTLNELQALGPQLVALTGGLQVGTATTSANVQQLISIMQSYQAEARRQAAQITRLATGR